MLSFFLSHALNTKRLHQQHAMSVQEIRLPNKKNGSTNRANESREGTNTQGQPTKRRRVNYNIQQLQAQQFDTSVAPPPDATPPIDKKAQRRFDELSRENYTDTRWEVPLPRSVTGLVIKRPTTSLSSSKSQAGAAVRRALVSRKNWSNWVEELGDSLRILDQVEVPPQKTREKLCSVCGSRSFSSCIVCKARVCSVRCQNVHKETRCT